MATQAERRAATREALVKAGRASFARAGYEATHTNEILAAAGVSRGAMYHHFPSKQALFEAVFVAESKAAIDLAAAAARRDGSPSENLLSACLAWLAAARELETAAILLDQGPQVLGWKRARDLEEEFSLGGMKRAIQRAAEAGELEVVSIDLAARILNAVLAELALAAVHHNDEADPAVQERMIRQVLSGFRPQTD
ncbi:MAG: helix-turn-helix domain-containing protein [Maricaulis sp.]|uniref:TetR/AcrR family transcriptional regulator n=1 Tax=Maricaulis sp. TaxID=1486257 RepID=UPI002625699B|nr:TetR/AcrR family transcriptional regulator [Maricaulis sp.]MDM7984050.1 helix-turn-helix domain-containing protein [Maricaulis sp.]